jgi:hypothetical protein
MSGETVNDCKMRLVQPGLSIKQDSCEHHLNSFFKLLAFEERFGTT